MLSEEAAGQVHVFGGDAQLALAPIAEIGGDILDVDHVGDVDPGLRRGDHDIGVAKAKASDLGHVAVSVGDLLADQVFSGDAEMRAAGSDLVSDFSRREEQQLNARQGGDRGGVVASAAPLFEIEPGAREEGRRLVLQPAFRRDRENDAAKVGRRHRVHRCILAASGRSIETIAPTAGTSAGAPSARASAS